MPCVSRMITVAGLLLAAIAPSASAASRSVRIGHAPRTPAGAKVVGSLPDTQTLSVTITLQPRDPLALESYALAVSTPGAPEYHRYLSVLQFAARFGPERSTISDVQASLRAHGLRPSAFSPNGLSIAVRASARTLAHAFSTSFNQV